MKTVQLTLEPELVKEVVLTGDSALAFLGEVTIAPITSNLRLAAEICSVLV
jgi:hypothetical protein